MFIILSNISRGHTACFSQGQAGASTWATDLYISVLILEPSLAQVDQRGSVLNNFLS